MSGSAGPALSFIVDGHRVAAKPLKPALYVVATPIGNLGDTTLRALATLAAANIVACEDTRVTAVLLRHYGIETRLLAYHDHNAERQRPKLMAALAEGKAVALVSDAGTPLISDPGYRLVAEAQAAGPCGGADPRRVGGARRAGRVGLADGQFLLRRVPAAEIGGADEAFGGSRDRAGDARLLRVGAACRRGPCRHDRGAHAMWHGAHAIDTNYRREHRWRGRSPCPSFRPSPMWR